MRRFFIEEIIKATDGSCVIKGNEARHITKVLRMDRGNRFILMDGHGDRYSAVIESIDRSGVVVRLSEKLQGPVKPDLDITLCQAVLKSGPMDYMIEKTSELGVTRIFPFFSDLTVARLEGMSAENKLRRWREIAVSAAKQADRFVPAEIARPGKFTEVLRQRENNDCLKVILWERENSRDLKELLKSSIPLHAFVGIVGPEGGFSAGEVEAAAQAGFVPVSLGRRILRAETAAMTLVAVVQYEWGDLSLKGGC